MIRIYQHATHRRSYEWNRVAATNMRPHWGSYEWDRVVATNMRPHRGSYEWNRVADLPTFDPIGGRTNGIGSRLPTCDPIGGRTNGVRSLSDAPLGLVHVLPHGDCRSQEHPAREGMVAATRYQHATPLGVVRMGWEFSDDSNLTTCDPI
jgi:hypothetical protein